MRESELYFAIAILFALFLTWRITSSVRKTMKSQVDNDETDSR